MAAPSPFFDKLPAEIRNAIYELTFEPESNEEVDLANPTPPSKAIVITCRKAYTEAAQLYKSAYRNYWRTTKFHATRHQPAPRSLGECTPAKPIDLNHINHISVTLKRHFVKDLTLTDPRGIWRRSVVHERLNLVVIRGPSQDFRRNNALVASRKTAEDYISGRGRGGFLSIAEQLEWLLSTC